MNGKISPERYQTYYRRGISDRAHYNATRMRLALGLPPNHRDYAKGLKNGSQEFLAWLDGWGSYKETLATPQLRENTRRFLSVVERWQKNWKRTEIKAPK